MKRLIGICFAFCLFAMVGTAQTTASTSANETAKKTCVPTKECAEKMGMTLAECKKVCNGKTANAETKVASALVALDSQESNTDPKKTAAAKKECAKKCTGAKSADATSDSETKVASALVVKDAEGKSTAKKNCSKTCKKTCAKKAE